MTCDVCGRKSTKNATKTNKGVTVRVNLCNRCYELWKLSGENFKKLVITNHFKNKK